MNRSNNRHNFVSRKDHGLQPSSSPFSKSGTDLTKAEAKPTAVKWNDVDPKIRTDTAKKELMMKMKARKSTINQDFVKQVEAGDHTHLGESGAHLDPSKSNQDLTQDPANDCNAAGTVLQSEGINDSDDEEEMDVYGWRFDEGGEEENNKHLEYNGPTKNNSISESAASPLQSFAGSFKASYQSMKELYTDKEKQEKAAAKVLEAVKAATNMTVNIARTSSKMVMEAADWMFQPEEDDKIGDLMKKTDSYMAIHDLSRAPSKDQYSKLRKEKLEAAVAEVRQFGNSKDEEGQETDESMMAVRNKLADDRTSGVIKTFERAMHTASFNMGSKKGSGVDLVRQKEKDRMSKEILFDSHHISPTHEREGEAPPEDHFRTLFDVKDVKSFKDDYYGSKGKGVSPIPSEKFKNRSFQLDKEKKMVKLPSVHESALNRSGSRSSISMALAKIRDENNSSVASTGTRSSTRNLPRINTHQDLLNTPLGSRQNLLARSPIAGTMGSRSRMSPLSSAANLKHLPGEEEEEVLSKSTLASNFLTAQLNKASKYLSASSPSLALATGKERIPPKKTATQKGFGRDDESSAELGEHSEKMSTPIKLLSEATKKAASFMGSFRLSPINDKENKAGMGGKKDSKGDLLTKRQKDVLNSASAGHGPPVIYAPYTARSEISDQASLYSHVTSLTNMLDIYDTSKSTKFRPASMQHLDLGQVAEVPEHEPTDMSKVNRIEEAADVGPDLPEKDIGDGTWRACWDFEASSVYYYNTITGEATWTLPEELKEKENEEEDDANDDFFRINNNGLPRGLSEMNLGESELTIKTRKIAARHSLYSKLRGRYEGDQETEYTAGLMAEEYDKFAKQEQSEILGDYLKEIDAWD